jgi:hypothetical protein
MNISAHTTARQLSSKMSAHRGLNLELIVGENGNGRAREQGGNQDKLVHGAALVPKE